MDSALRPRDIQTRIRAGESPETVAQAAQTSVDKIMAFAAPVLAERQHVAQRAQRSSVRRPEGTGGARTLGDAVDAHLRALNVDPESVEWDAWRREDGRWPLTASYTSARAQRHRRVPLRRPRQLRHPRERRRPVAGRRGGRRRRAGPGRPAPGAPAPAQLGRRPRRRAAARRRRHRPGHRAAGRGVPRRPSRPPTPRWRPRRPSSARRPPTPPPRRSRTSEHEPPHRREVKKTRGRASVPSWDEIMFGGGDSRTGQPAELRVATSTGRLAGSVIQPDQLPG